MGLCHYFRRSHNAATVSKNQVQAQTIMKRFFASISEHTVLVSLAALCVYTILSCLFFAHCSSFSGRSYLGVHGDPAVFMWFISWWPYAISNHLNPFTTRVLWAPGGINLSWTICIPSLALLLWPITTLWGPVVSFTIATLAGLALGAFAAFLLCYELTDQYCPSLVGGWLFGFSSYEIAQLCGHLALDFVACLPTLVWLGVMRYKGGIGPRVFFVASSITLVFQFGTSTELFATATFFGCIALTLIYLRQAADTESLVRVGKGLAWSYVLCAIIVSPYLYYTAKEFSSIPALLQPRNVYVSDVLNYVVPTPITYVGGSWAASISKTFTGNDMENGAYLGLPLLVIIAAFAVVFWRRRWAQVLLGMCFMLVLCSFGPYLHFMGRSLLPMPWWLGEKLPLLNQALPARFSLFVALVTTIMVALWLAGLKGRRALGGYVLAGVSMLCLVPNLSRKPAYWFTELRVPAFFSDGDYKRLLKLRENVVVLPYGNLEKNVMLWQAESGMYFRMAGGYVGAYTPAAFARWPIVQMFYAGKPSQGYENSLTAFCGTHEVSAIILADDSAKEWDLPLHKIGWERKQIGDVVIYRVPQAVIHKYYGSTEPSDHDSYVAPHSVTRSGRLSCKW